MPRKENDPSRFHRPGERRRSSTFPQDLQEFLHDKPYGCWLQDTETLGSVFVVKVPTAEVPGLREDTPILVRHELHPHPAAPVIRTVFVLFDRPENPLLMDVFTNPADPRQRQAFADVGNQRALTLLFYDDAGRRRLTKRVENNAMELIPQILRDADRLRQAIPDDQVDFDQARADVIEMTAL